MKINRVKHALAAGRLQIGTGYGQLRSPEAVRILAAAGFDWIFVDTEHGAFGHESVQDLCRAATDNDLVPIVRVANMEYDLVARALDCGGQGVIFPRVESVELLSQAVKWAKFPPEGVRGFGLTPTHVNYERATIAEILAHMNREILVVLQIETVRAVEMRDELLSVPGIDAVMVGPVDLSISLGVAGDFQHPKMVEAMEKIRDTCNAHNIAPGTQTRSLGLAKFWKERGMRFLGCSSETGMLWEKATEIAGSLSADAASA